MYLHGPSLLSREDFLQLELHALEWEDLKRLGRVLSDWEQEHGSWCSWVVSLPLAMT